MKVDLRLKDARLEDSRLEDGKDYMIRTVFYREYKDSKTVNALHYKTKKGTC